MPGLLKNQMSKFRGFSEHSTGPCVPPGKGMCIAEQYITAYLLYSLTLDKCLILYFNYQYNITNSYFSQTGYSIFVGKKPSNDTLKSINQKWPDYHIEIYNQMAYCLIDLNKAIQALINEEIDKLREGKRKLYEEDIIVEYKECVPVEQPVHIADNPDEEANTST
jgi:hypothetical protein